MLSIQKYIEEYAPPPTSLPTRRVKSILPEEEDKESES